MKILSDFAKSSCSATYRNWGHSAPSTPGWFQLYGQVMQLSCALELASLATGHQLFRWHWAILPPVALAQAVNTLGADQASPSALKRRLIRLQHHFGDLCQAVCVISAVALYRQGDRLKGGATISMIGLNYVQRFGIASSTIRTTQLSLKALSKIVTLDPTLFTILSPVLITHFRDDVLSAMIRAWPKLSQLKPSPAEAFLPVESVTGKTTSLTKQLNEMDKDDCSNGLATVLSEKKMWVQYYDSGLDAKAFCKQGLDAVLKEAESNHILNGWLKVIAEHEEADDALITIAAAGHFPASGGRWIHTIYSKLTNNALSNIELLASIAALDALSDSYEREERESAAAPLLAKPYILMAELLFAPLVTPSARLDGEVSKVHPITAALVADYFMDFFDYYAGFFDYYTKGLDVALSTEERKHYLLPRPLTAEEQKNLGTETLLVALDLATTGVMLREMLAPAVDPEVNEE